MVVFGIVVAAVIVPAGGFFGIIPILFVALTFDGFLKMLAR